MALDFPSSPVDGQISGNYVWSASSGAWKARPQLQQTSTQSSSAPSSANQGDIWIDTTDGSSYHYLDDGTSKQWVELISSGIPSTPVDVLSGGTGATTSATARANLGAASLSGGNTFTGTQLTPDSTAFLAYHQASDLTYAVNATLAYPYTVYNIGNAYNTSTSTFTAPVAGRYLFSVNAQGSRDTGIGGVPRAYWKINGANVANGIHLRGSDATGNGLEQRSQTVIFNLSANDNVKIVVGENRWDLFAANFFMGYLIG